MVQFKAWNNAKQDTTMQAEIASVLAIPIFQTNSASSLWMFLILLLETMQVHES